MKLAGLTNFLEELIINVFAKVLPVFLSLIMSSGDFTRSVMVAGFETYPDRCVGFKAAKTLGFPCVACGAGALGIVVSVVSLVVSLTVSAMLPTHPIIRASILSALVLLLFWLLVYAISWKKELFRFEETMRQKLEQRKKPWADWCAKRVVFVMTLIFFIGSLVVSALSVVYASNLLVGKP